MTTNFISVQEFKDAAPDVDLSRYTDTTTSGVITRATARAEKFLEYTLPKETVTDEKIDATINENFDFILYPRKIPIDSLTSVSIVKGSFSAAITLTSGDLDLFDIPTSADRIIIPGSTVTFDTVSVIDFRRLRLTDFFAEITYVAGYDMYDRPQDIIDAIVLYTRDELARTLNTAGAKRITQGAVSIDYAQRTGKSDHIKDAENILSKYRNVARF